MNDLATEVARLRAIVEAQQERIDALAPPPRQVSRRDAFTHAAAATVGALIVGPRVNAQTITASEFLQNTLLEGYTGIGNTAYGSLAGANLNPDDLAGDEGRLNTAVGVEALYNAVPDSIGQGFGAQRNTGVGRGALRDMFDGYYNDAFGADAGRHSNRTNRNTFLGNNAGKWVGSIDPEADKHPWWEGPGVQDIENQGCRNVMIGRNAGHEGVRAQSCIAIGYNAGANWGSNDSTIAIGRNSLIDNRNASRTVSIGAYAMTNSVTGGEDCVAVGHESLKLAAANNNTAVGTFAGRNCQGGQNVYVGEQAGAFNAPGTDNVMVGRHAGQNTDGSRNIFLGRLAGRDHAGRDNTLIIHNSASFSPFIEGSMGENGAWWLQIRGDVTPNADGAWALGTSARRWKEVWALDGTINVSDVRMKTDIADEDLGVEFIESLRPVVWKWRDGDGTDRRGLIAQEVQAAAHDTDSPRPFTGVVDEGGALGLRERELIGPLIKAVQELSERLKAVEAAGPYEP